MAEQIAHAIELMQLNVGGSQGLNPPLRAAVSGAAYGEALMLEPGAVAEDAYGRRLLGTPETWRQALLPAPRGRGRCGVVPGLPPLGAPPKDGVWGPLAVAQVCRTCRLFLEGAMSQGGSPLWHTSGGRKVLKRLPRWLDHAPAMWDGERFRPPVSYPGSPPWPARLCGEAEAEAAQQRQELAAAAAGGLANTAIHARN